MRVDLLVIDDFALQPMDSVDTTDVYELIVERHRTASTVVTSNREPVEWLRLMADPLLAQSAFDRLQSAAHGGRCGRGEWKALGDWLVTGPSAASWIGAKRSTTSAASSPSAIAIMSATATTTTRRCRPTASRWSRMRACCRRPLPPRGD